MDQTTVTAQSTVSNDLLNSVKITLSVAARDMKPRKATNMAEANGAWIEAPATMSHDVLHTVVSMKLARAKRELAKQTERYPNTFFALPPFSGQKVGDQRYSVHLAPYAGIVL
jgi:hypothetical protein